MCSKQRPGAVNLLSAFQDNKALKASLAVQKILTGADGVISGVRLWWESQRCLADARRRKQLLPLLSKAAGIEIQSSRALMWLKDDKRLLPDEE